MVKMLESKTVEVVEDPEPKPKVDKLRPKVVAELVSQQEISPRLMKVVELPIEILVNLPAEPFIDLIPNVAAMRTSFFLRSSDVYNPLQILIQEPISQEIGILVNELDFIRAELTCHVVCILLELPSMDTCFSHKSVSPPPHWLRCDALVFVSRPPS